MRREEIEERRKQLAVAVLLSSLSRPARPALAHILL